MLGRGVGQEHRQGDPARGFRGLARAWAAVQDGEGDWTCGRSRKENFQNLVVDRRESETSGWSPGFWVGDWANGVPH